MAERERRDQEEVSLGIANELVEFANSKVDAGVHPMVVAPALRHAAANFTAFAFRATDDPLDTESIMGISCSSFNFMIAATEVKRVR